MTMADLTLLDLQDLAEEVDLEAKAAQGQYGMGEVPKSFFETYSAMANTNGGTVFFGIGQNEDKKFSVIGIEDAAKVRKELWDGLNNREQINANILRDENVSVAHVEGKQVLRIDIPRADRRKRPIYVGQNPLTGTYRRNYEGDYHCDEETVRRMMSDAIEDTRDTVLLEGFTFKDLDAETFAAYRNEFKSTKPGHPWLALDDQELLRNLGGWTNDRRDNKEGLTFAGLLMFGKLRPILDAAPYYLVDYQEQSGLKGDPRWIDRMTTDGTWSGNLFDFYRRVYAKLTAELKVPFRLEGGAKRIDETAVHEALREAMVNALIHADYTGRVGILVIKWPDRFGFRNPGGLRMPPERALAGGISDCRNRNLQKMFQLIGAGEQAGSGLPKVLAAWKEQHWRTPQLAEHLNPDQTTLVLRMVSFLPRETLEALDRRIGPKFHSMSPTQRLALATVAIEGKVSHDRLKEISTEHPHDLSKELAALARDKFLDSSGATRAKIYYFPGEPPYPELGLQSTQTAGALNSSVHLPPSSVHLPPSSVHLASQNKLAETVRNKGKVPKATMEAAILAVCKGTFIALKALSEILDRSPETLRIHYLIRMVKDGRLELHYPESPNHPNQAYRSRE
ncbi:MAG: putative DNA binding domain-containing protein [Elusimicrobia bacterium]|nr:putative DNA binding domain-containing protein [Elusimicrobiota bacterium]